MQEAMNMVISSACKDKTVPDADGNPSCTFSEATMQLRECSDAMTDCLKDKSKKLICKPAAAIIDNLKDKGYASGKKDERGPNGQLLNTGKKMKRRRPTSLATSSS